MAEEGDIVVKGWAKGAIAAGVSLLLVAFGLFASLESRFVNKKEHEEHEANDRQEVARIDATLIRHLSDTRTESVRLSVIEAQLGTIQRQLELMDAKLDHAARSRSAGLVR